MRDIELTCGESTFEEKCHVLYGFPEEDGYTEPEEEYDGELAYIQLIHCIFHAYSEFAWQRDIRVGYCAGQVG